MARKIEIEIVGDSSSFSKALGRASGDADSFGSSLSKIGKVAAVAGAVLAGGLAIGLKKSVESAVDFERSMRNVNSIADLSEKQFKALGKSVTGMAADVGQKPKVLADGLYDIVSSGFKANDAVKILAVSAKAATAGMTDTSTATKAVTAALNAYHQGAGDAREVSDILFQTVNKGVLTFEELSQQMGDLVPASAPLGISLKEVGAGMATLTLQGVPAAEAATRMKNAMLSLAKPTPALSALLKEQGFASGEAAIKSKGFAGVLDILSEATHGSVSAQSKLTPEIRTLLGVVGLTGKNLATYNAILRDMDEATKGAGITAKVFAEQSKSVAVMWQKVGAGIEVLKIQIGTALLPVLKKALDGVSSFLAEFNQAEGASAKFKVAMDAIKSVASQIGTKLKDAFKEIDWAAVWGETTAMGLSLATKIGDAVGGIDWALVWGKAQGIGEGLQANLAAVDWSGVGAAIGTGIATGIQTAGEIAKKLTDVIAVTMRSVDWEGLGRAAGPGLAAAMLAAFATLLDPGFWIRNWDLTIAVAITAFTGPFGKLGAFLIKPFAKLGGDLILALVSGIEAFAPRVAAVLLAALLKLPVLAGAALGKLTDLVGSVFSKLSGLAVFTAKVLGLTAVINAVTSMASSVGRKLASVVGAIQTAGQEWTTAAIAAAGKIVSGLIQGLANLGGKVLAELGQVALAVMNIRGAAAAAAAAVGQAIISGIISGLAGLITSVGSAIASKANAAITWARDHVGSTVDQFAAKMLGEPMAKGVIDGWMLGIAPLGGKIANGLNVAVQTAAGGIGQLTAHLAKQEATWTAYGVALTTTEAKLASMSAAQEKAALASAVIEARTALSAANAMKAGAERNKAILDAEQQMRTAQLAILTASLTQQAESERVHRDKEVAGHQAQIEKIRAVVAAKTEVLNAAFTKMGENLERAFGAKTQAMVGALGAKFDAQIASVRAWAAELTQAEQALAAFDKIAGPIGGGATASETELASLDKSEAERERQRALLAAEAALAKAQAVEDTVERAAAVAAAEEQMRSAQLAITRAALSEKAAAERAAAALDLADRQAAHALQREELLRQAEFERQQRDFQAAEQIKSLETARAAEIQNLEETRAQQLVQLQKQLSQLQTHLANHPKEYGKTMAAIKKLLASHEIPMEKAGENLGEAFAKGLASANAAVEKAAQGLAKVAAQNLKVKSPTEKGPMSTLDRWWSNLGKTLVSGIDYGTVSQAAARLAGSMSTAPTMSGFGVAGGGSSGALRTNGQPLVVQVQLDGRTIAEATYPHNLAVDKNRGGRMFNHTAPVLS